ncbi:S-layer homology domain-containing protein [Aeromicrobium marinum]|nr:S-layer homology domain-containing protein [Aeromicrobium marinum]
MMRVRGRRPAVVVGMVVGVIATVLPFAASAAPSSSVAGTVTEAGTGDPVEDVVVRFNRQIDGGPVLEGGIRTRADGAYTRPTEPGQYTVCFYSRAHTPTCTDEFVLAADEMLTGLDAVLTVDPEAAEPTVAPTGLALDDQEPVSTTSVGATWDAAAYGLFAYGVAVSVDGEPIDIQYTESTETELVVDGLEPGTEYKLTVAALLPSGQESVQSAPLTVTTEDVPVGLVDPPSNLRLDRTVAPASDAIAVEWDPSDDEVSQYAVYYADDDSRINGVQYVDGDETSLVVDDGGDGLEANVSYTLTVQAVGAADDVSGPSNEIRVSTLAEGEFPDFSDTVLNTFAYEIDWLASTGITTGYDDGTFRPGQPVLREQMAAFLYRLETLRLGEEPWVDMPEESPFTDVPETHEFYREMVWLEQEGITTGYDNGDETISFRPSEPVLREQMAAFLYRFDFQDFTSEGEPTFNDVAPGFVFFDEIEWLALTGITTGYDDGTFRGGQPVLREQMAAFLYRYNLLPFEEQMLR